MTTLIFDTETTGFAQYGYGPSDPRQPHLVQIAYQELDEKTGEVAEFSAIVKPEGWEIPDQVVEVHGITTTQALAEGYPLVQAIHYFVKALKRATRLVAHNIPFDVCVMRTALCRAGVDYAKFDDTRNCDHYCTDASSRDVVQCPPTEKMIKAGRCHWKSPKLEEAYKHFTGLELVGAHSALADVRACACVYNSLIKLGITKGKKRT